jgi:hypothetical protein
MTFSRAATGTRIIVSGLAGSTIVACNPIRLISASLWPA